MSPAVNHSKVIATLMLLFLEGIGAIDESMVVYVPCKGGSNRLLQLEELIHISDIVMYGVVLSSTITQDEFGTFEASISYYHAYKNDPQLYRRGLASVNVLDFPERPSAENALFFLVRQPNTELSLYCMATLSELDNSLQHVYDGLFEIVEKVKEVATADIERNKQFVPPYPDPCDSNNCSSVGSHCTLMNTLTNETSRCTCISGFYGDGFSCTPRTDGAVKMECLQCTHGARCVSRPPSQPELLNGVIVDNSQEQEEVGEVEQVIECSCEHYRCTNLAARALCATNGVTYGNECHMRKEACKLQKDIYKLHNGQCRPNSIQPCGGLGTPLSTSAGLVNCSGTRQCPMMHFCHSTSKFAVCCPVTAPISITTQRLVTTTAASPSSGSGDDDRDIESSASGSGASGDGSESVDLAGDDNAVDW